MSAADGGPAFPHSRLGSDCDGMTLRDYFAAMAMQAMVIASSTIERDSEDVSFRFAMEEGVDSDDTGSTWSYRETVCDNAYTIADQMIIRREVVPPDEFA